MACRVDTNTDSDGDDLDLHHLEIDDIIHRSSDDNSTEESDDDTDCFRTEVSVQSIMSAVFGDADDSEDDL